MKVTEFRISNLAIDKLTKEILICCGLYCDTDGSNTRIDFAVLDRGKYPLPDGWQAKPIPLTEEWLLRFGFNLKSKKDGTRGVYSNGKMNFILSNSGNVYTMRNKLIPYVHTFQNHYYYSILDEEELTLNK